MKATARREGEGTMSPAQHVNTSSRAATQLSPPAERDRLARRQIELERRMESRDVELHDKEEELFLQLEKAIRLEEDCEKSGTQVSVLYVGPRREASDRVCDHHYTIETDDCAGSTPLLSEFYIKLTTENITGVSRFASENGFIMREDTGKWQHFPPPFVSKVYQWFDINNSHSQNELQSDAKSRGTSNEFVFVTKTDLRYGQPTSHRRISQLIGLIRPLIDNCQITVCGNLINQLTLTLGGLRLFYSTQDWMSSRRSLSRGFCGLDGLDVARQQEWQLQRSRQQNLVRAPIKLLTRKEFSSKNIGCNHVNILVESAQILTEECCGTIELFEFTARKLKRSRKLMPRCSNPIMMPITVDRDKLIKRRQCEGPGDVTPDPPAVTRARDAIVVCFLRHSSTARGRYRPSQCAGGRYWSEACTGVSRKR
ncbi:hypothetical protein J6590_062308 [Homalodisca vitripennis]|nr:hypothetical protein J6590_062308 [Homalodisca vitripennis]